MNEEENNKGSNLSMEELKNQLNEKQKMIENLQNSQSVFLSNLSQNIRIPLNGIIGMIDVMKMTNVTEEQADYLNIINKYGDSLIVIVNDILDYSKIIADELVFENKYFYLSQIGREIDQSYRIRTDGKGLQLNINIDKGLPQQIYSDSYRLHQILASLMSNAVKFTKSGSIGFSIKKLEQKNSKLNIRFIIEDTGFGMTTSKIKQIRAELAKPTKETILSTNGIGLGMSISQALLRLLGSELHFESEEKKGSKFWFDLEFEYKQNHNGIKEEISLGNNKKLSILLVEDNILNQKFAVATLTRNGHDVMVAENGKIAYEKFIAGQFDLILMDVQMPIMDGVQATINIRKWEREKNHKPIKIVAVTAYALDRDRDRCLNSGMDKFLAKPFKPEQLMGIIENLEFD